MSDNKTPIYRLKANKNYDSKFFQVKARLPKEFEEPLKNLARSENKSINQLLCELVSNKLNK